MRNFWEYLHPSALIPSTLPFYCYLVPLSPEISASVDIKSVTSHSSFYEKKKHKHLKREQMAESLAG